ncbi:MAG TPA: hypothetical protein VIK24_19195, partial [Pyrinomonadaceae bacterium]
DRVLMRLLRRSPGATKQFPVTSLRRYLGIPLLACEAGVSVKPGGRAPGRIGFNNKPALAGERLFN